MDCDNSDDVIRHHRRFNSSTSIHVHKIRPNQGKEELASNSFDTVITTSVLEHAECPICEVRGLLRILKPGGILMGTVSGMGSSSMVWKPNDMNNELQVFGALEFS